MYLHLYLLFLLYMFLYILLTSRAMPSNAFPRFLFPPPALACARLGMFSCLRLAVRSTPTSYTVRHVSVSPCTSRLLLFSSYASICSPLFFYSRSFFLFVVLSLLSLIMLYQFLLFQVSLQLLQQPPCPPPPCVNKFWTHPPCRSR